jgi:hypothetical protein
LELCCWEYAQQNKIQQLLSSTAIMPQTKKERAANKENLFEEVLMSLGRVWVKITTPTNEPSI